LSAVEVCMFGSKAVDSCSTSCISAVRTSSTTESASVGTLVTINGDITEGGIAPALTVVATVHRRDDTQSSTRFVGVAVELLSMTAVHTLTSRGSGALWEAGVFSNRLIIEFYVSRLVSLYYV
jgi:hypothetical protein